MKIKHIYQVGNSFWHQRIHTAGEKVNFKNLIIVSTYKGIYICTKIQVSLTTSEKVEE